MLKETNETISRWRRIAKMEFELGAHDCHASPEDGCECYAVREEINQLREEDKLAI